MAKKKDKNQPITHIQNFNLEIDYDELATSIVKAQEKAVETTRKQKRYTVGTFATPLIIVFYGMSILGWILVASLPIGVYKIRESFRWNGFTECFSSVITLLFILGIMVMVALYSILLWKSAKEVEAETDRNYIISMFSGVISFVALIVALVALVKG
ncbi:MAG: hypothetical protein E7385_06785 [Ruminococcaceae bacterium]|nr:hypothetical protein [Oscillospiraceae bacterium]